MKGVHGSSKNLGLGVQDKVEVTRTCDAQLGTPRGGLAVDVGAAQEGVGAPLILAAGQSRG